VREQRDVGIGDQPERDPPNPPYRIEVSASRLFSQVSICEPSVAAACPSPHIRATSSFANALMTSADALWIFPASACLFPAV
jgi:hypothetical protein